MVLTKEHMFYILLKWNLDERVWRLIMEKFVLAGKAKTVFQIIELMAKGEELKKQQSAAENKMKIIKENTYQIWPTLN